MFLELHVEKNKNSARQILKPLAKLSGKNFGHFWSKNPKQSIFQNIQLRNFLKQMTT